MTKRCQAPIGHAATRRRSPGSGVAPASPLPDRGARCLVLGGVPGSRGRVTYEPDLRVRGDRRGGRDLGRRTAPGAPARTGRGLVHERRPGRRHVRRARDWVRDPARVRRLPVVRELRPVPQRRRVGGGHRRAAVRDGAVPARGGAWRAVGRAGVLRPLRGQPGVAADGARPSGRDQPLGPCPVHDAEADRPADARRTGGLRQVVRPDQRPRSSARRPHPRRRGRDAEGRVDRPVLHGAP